MTITVIGISHGYRIGKHELPNDSSVCVMKAMNIFFGSEINWQHVPLYPVPKVHLRIPLKQKEVENDPDPPAKTFVFTLIKMMTIQWI